MEPKDLCDAKSRILINFRVRLSVCNAYMDLNRIGKRECKNHPEHGCDETNGEREERLYHITEHCGGTRRKKRKTAVPLAVNGEKQQANEQKHSRNAVVCEMGKIFIMGIVKVIREGNSVLLIRNDQSVL